MNTEVADKIIEHMNPKLKENFSSGELLGEIKDFLQELVWKSGIIAELHRTSRRWWDEYIAIVRLPNSEVYIGFDWAFANRDESLEELGWEWNWDSVKEYEPVEIVTTAYIEKN